MEKVKASVTNKSKGTETTITLDAMVKIVPYLYKVSEH